MYRDEINPCMSCLGLSVREDKLLDGDDDSISREEEEEEEEVERCLSLMIERACDE